MANFWRKPRPFYWKTHPDNLGCFGPEFAKMSFPEIWSGSPKNFEKKLDEFSRKTVQHYLRAMGAGGIFTFENVLGPEKDRITGNLTILHEFWGVTSDVLLENSSS